MATRYWLMKSEPDTYSIDHLARDGVTPWEGVRNFQARNLLRNEIHVGDSVLFYHSSTQPPGVAGLAEVVHESYPDRTQFDPASPYFDPKSTPEVPRWFVVDVRFGERFPAVVPLAVLQKTPGLEDMKVTKKGMRLSVQPVTPEEWHIVVALGRAARPAEPETPAEEPVGAQASAPAPNAKGKPGSKTRGDSKAKTGSKPKTDTKPKTDSKKPKAGAARTPPRKSGSGAREGSKRAAVNARGTKVADTDRTPGRGRPSASRR